MALDLHQVWFRLAYAGTRPAVRQVRLSGGDVIERNLPELLQSLAKAAAEIPVTTIPVLVGDLERLKTVLLARLVNPPNGGGQPETVSESDRLLTSEEAAEILNVTPRWLYRHHKHLPFTRRLSRKALRFSEAGLRKYLAAKRA